MIYLNPSNAHVYAYKLKLWAYIAVLDEEIAWLKEQIRVEEMARAKGIAQVPRKLPTVPGFLKGWDGSFCGIPDNWADHLKPSPLKIRYSSEREQDWSAMRILLHPKLADDGMIWVKRGGRCMCFYVKALKGLGIPQRVHPFYAPCWKERMTKIPAPEKDNTPLAVWKKDKRSPWGGWYVGSVSKAKIFDLHSLPLRKIYQVNMTEDDKELARQQTLRKWSAWVSKPSPKKKVKPEITLAQIRAARLFRKGILKLREEVLTLNQ